MPFLANLVCACARVLMTTDFPPPVGPTTMADSWKAVSTGGVEPLWRASDGERVSVNSHGSKKYFNSFPTTSGAKWCHDINVHVNKWHQTASACLCILQIAYACNSTHYTYQMLVSRILIKNRLYTCQHLNVTKHVMLLQLTRPCLLQPSTLTTRHNKK